MHPAVSTTRWQGLRCTRSAYLCAETCSFALRARQAQCELFSSTVIFPIIVLRSPPSVEVWEPERDLSLHVLFEMPRNRPVKCRVPPKISVTKPSTAPPRPPVPLRGRCATLSKISPIRLQRSRSRSDGCSAECTVRFDLERCVFADERHLLN
jgi:hypothetical protein